MTRIFRRPRPLTIALLALVTASAGWASVGAFQGQAPERLDVLITFRSAPGPADDLIVQGLGGLVSHRYQIVPGMAASLPSAAVNALLNNPRVAAVELDGRVFAIDAELDNTWGVSHIGAGEVHAIDGVTGAGVKVGVIDSGIDLGHPDLALNYAGGHDFVNGDGTPFDDNGHGTHVAGTVAALDNDAGVVGVAPGASLFAYKVLDASGGGAWSNIIAALDRAVTDGVQITNNSYGSAGDPGTLVAQAFANSAAAGILHIAAAGNSGNCGGRGNSVGYPARYASVIAVGATNSNDARPCFSSTGPDVELSAPGVAINSTVPGGGYAEFSGTSMASPHVAGLAALVVAAGVASADEVRSLLAATAVDLGSAGRDSYYGYGRVDAVAAVTAAGGGGGGGGGDDGGGGGTDPTETVSVQSIGYSMSGGRTSDKHLLITVTVVDENSNAVAGASVSVEITLNNVLYASSTGTTGTGGQVVFEIKNAPSGCYSTVVTAVSGGGTWDGTSPAHSPFCK